MKPAGINIFLKDEMKTAIIVIVSLFLLFTFLAYGGFFRNNKDPLVISKYYFECLKNREGFLTYQISTHNFFNDDRDGRLFYKYKLHNLAKFQPGIALLKDNIANVELELVYKDKRVIQLFVELEQNEKDWLIRNINPKTVPQ